jgi:hypothetical protein
MKIPSIIIAGLLSFATNMTSLAESSGRTLEAKLMPATARCKKGGFLQGDLQPNPI